MDTSKLTAPYQKANGRWYISHDPTIQSFRDYDEAIRYYNLINNQKTK